MGTSQHNCCRSSTCCSGTVDLEGAADDLELRREAVQRGGRADASDPDVAANALELRRKTVQRGLTPTHRSAVALDLSEGRSRGVDVLDLNQLVQHAVEIAAAASARRNFSTSTVSSEH